MTALRIKVDEDLPVIVTRLLLDAGYDAVRVPDQRMGGWDDRSLWDAVQSEKRFLITADKGFSDLRVYPPGTHGGVLVLRPDDDGIRPMEELMRLVLDGFRLDELVGVIAVATPRGLRIRRLMP